MTETLKQHLIRREHAMQAAKPILGKAGFPTHKRTLTTSVTTIVLLTISLFLKR